MDSTLKQARLICIIVFVFVVKGNTGDKIGLKLPVTTRDAKGLCHFPDVITIEILRHGQQNGWKVDLRHHDVIPSVGNVYIMRTDVHDRTILKSVQVHGEHEAVQAYHNPKYGAAFSVSCTSVDKRGPFYVLEGSIFRKGRKYRIDPSPTWRQRIVLGHGHVTAIYNLREVTEFNPTDRTASKVAATRSRVSSTTAKRVKRHSVQKRQAREYTIDILPIVDNSMFERWRRNAGSSTEAIASIRKYLINIFSAVDMRMETLSLQNGRQLSIRMVQPIVYQTPLDPPYKTSVIEITNNNEAKMNATLLLESFRDWHFGQTGLPSHDHAMLFTSTDIYGGGDDGIKFNVTKGLAYVGTVCDFKDSVSIIEDKGAYQSEGVTAHELGHSLGSVHDGEDNNCRSVDRYLMADATYTINQNNQFNPWRFSSCSSNSISNVIAELEQTSSLNTCLRATSGEVVGSQLKAISVLEQCQTFYGLGSFACRGGELPSFDKVCDTFYCRIPNTILCERMTAASGTCCGNNKMCESGRCVPAGSGECPMDDACPLGDQPGIIKDDKNCSQLEPIYCYIDDISLRCCETCPKLATGAAGCVYGDKVLGCERDKCGSVFVDGTSYDFLCCETCSAACLDRKNVFDADTSKTYNCSELVAARGSNACYSQSVHYDACCETCESVRDAENEACPWGDKANCAAFLNTAVGYTCPDSFRDSCCYTCPLIESRTVAPTTKVNEPVTTVKTDATRAEVTTPKTVTQTPKVDPGNSGDTTTSPDGSNSGGQDGGGTTTSPDGSNSGGKDRGGTTDSPDGNNSDGKDGDDDDGDDNTIMFVGIGVGAAVLLLIIIIVIVCCCRKANNKPPAETRHQNVDQPRGYPGPEKYQGQSNRGFNNSRGANPYNARANMNWGPDMYSSSASRYSNPYINENRPVYPKKIEKVFF